MKKFIACSPNHRHHRLGLAVALIMEPLLFNIQEQHPLYSPGVRVHHQRSPHSPIVQESSSFSNGSVVVAPWIGLIMRNGSGAVVQIEFQRYFKYVFATPYTSPLHSEPHHHSTAQHRTTLVAMVIEITLLFLLHRLHPLLCQFVPCNRV